MMNTDEAIRRSARIKAAEAAALAFGGGSEPIDMTTPARCDEWSRIVAERESAWRSWDEGMGRRLP